MLKFTSISKSTLAIVSSVLIQNYFQSLSTMDSDVYTLRVTQAYPSLGW